MTDDVPVVELRRVGKSYGEFRALREIDLRIGQGEQIVICGPSGSGKSTLIRCINRLESFETGELLIDGIHCIRRRRVSHDCVETSAWSSNSSTCSRI